MTTSPIFCYLRLNSYDGITHFDKPIVHGIKPLLSGVATIRVGPTDATPLRECAMCHHLRGGDNHQDSNGCEPWRSWLGKCCGNATRPAFMAGPVIIHKAGPLVGSNGSLTMVGMNSRLSPAACHACLCLLLCSWHIYPSFKGIQCRYGLQARARARAWARVRVYVWVMM